MLKEILKESLNVIKFTNLSLIQPLLLFMIAIMFATTPFLKGMGNPIIMIITAICIIAIISAFLAGTYYSYKKAIEYTKLENITDSEKLRMSYRIFGDFLEGVGEYFTKFLGFTIFYFIIAIIFSIILSLFIKHYIGFPEFYSNMDFKSFITTNEATEEFLKTISQSDKIKLAKINFLIYVIVFILQYLIMFAPIAIVNGKNTLSAFFESLKRNLKKPFTTLIMFFCFIFTFASTSFVGMLFAKNILIGFATILAQVIILAYFLVMLFLYYEKTEPQQKEINSDCGSDCVRED